VLGGDLDHRLEAELVELDGSTACPLVVGLVHGHQHRHRDRPQAFSDFEIAGNQALAAIHHEDDDIGGFQRAPPRDDDELVQRVLTRAEHAPGIDQRERNSLPLSRLRDHVARGAGDGGDDRSPGVRNPVEEGGLPDVRAADQHDRRAVRGAFLWHAKVYLAPGLTA
jgi:hypothetical protein